VGGGSPPTRLYVTRCKGDEGEALREQVKVEAEKAKDDAIVSNIRVIMMNPSGLDILATEFWDIQRKEFMKGKSMSTRWPMLLIIRWSCYC
jgi:hypothetical protein